MDFCQGCVGIRAFLLQNHLWKQRGKGLIRGGNPKIKGTEPAVGKGRDACSCLCLPATSGGEGMGRRAQELGTRSDLSGDGSAHRSAPPGVEGGCGSGQGRRNPPGNDYGRSSGNSGFHCPQSRDLRAGGAGNYRAGTGKDGGKGTFGETRPDRCLCPGYAPA